MITYSFEDIGDDSLYGYLYKRVRQDILDGKIAAGEKLPSKRSFAKNLGVSVITVENAYAQLVAEGYLYSVPKSGYYAAEIQRDLLTPEPEVDLKRRQAGGLEDRISSSYAAEPKSNPKRLQEIEGESRICPTYAAEPEANLKRRKTDGERMPGSRRVLGSEEGQKGSIGENASQGEGIDLQDTGGDMIDLVSSRTDARQFPFAVWARLMREALSSRQEELMTNAPGAGILQLREAIARYLWQFQGMRVSGEQIIIGAGTEYLYGLLIQLLGQEKTYALEDPGYWKMARIYEGHLVKTAFIPMDEKGMRMDRLRESGADVVHISPSHHYPTGITTAIGRRYELLGWADEREGRYIIEDDYDCEFRLAGRRIPSLQSIDQLGRVIYMNTFTKSLTSTIRISYMVLPWELRQRFQERLGFYACTVSNFEQYTLAEFIGRGYFEKHINRMRNYYRGKRDALLAAISASPLANHTEIRGEDSGLHFLMKIETDLTDRELTARAADEGIRISCLSQYYYDAGKKQRENGQAVIHYAGLKEGEGEIVAEKLYRAWFEEPLDR